MFHYGQGQWVFVFNIQNGFRTLGILTNHNVLFLCAASNWFGAA
jgi:hypothetical protein